ncbi:hypothetical protein JW879_05280, partial [candidate division WOR-3 bacterium]|nr:hypothetical protein [candidate division WOR-3 bacterium]
SVSPNPSAEEIIARLESNIPMVFLFELPAKVIEKIKSELGMPAAMLKTLVNPNIIKDKQGNRTVYTIIVSNTNGEKYILKIRDDGNLESKQKI